MEDWWLRVSHNLAARLDGPLHFRFVLQPLMSIVIAIRDGLRDARNGDRAYLWSIVIDSDKRPASLRAGAKSVARLFVLAFGVDVIYQIAAFRKFYPTEALITALLLAAVPYVLLRGPVNRIGQNLWRQKSNVPPGALRPAKPS